MYRKFLEYYMRAIKISSLLRWGIEFSILSVSILSRLSTLKTQVFQIFFTAVIF